MMIGVGVSPGRRHRKGAVAPAGPIGPWTDATSLLDPELGGVVEAGGEVQSVSLTGGYPFEMQAAGSGAAITLAQVDGREHIRFNDGKFLQNIPPAAFTLHGFTLFLVGYTRSIGSATSGQNLFELTGGATSAQFPYSNGYVYFWAAGKRIYINANSLGLLDTPHLLTLIYDPVNSRQILQIDGVTRASSTVETSSSTFTEIRFAELQAFDLMFSAIYMQLTPGGSPTSVEKEAEVNAALMERFGIPT